MLPAIIRRLPPEMARLTRAVLTKMRRLHPGATELVYDKPRSLVIGFCSTERASSVINSVGVYRKWINLYFFEGDSLPDPEGLLQGSGSTVRSIRITDAATLDRPAIRQLIAAARRQANPRPDARARRRVIIRQGGRKSAIINKTL